MRLGIGRLKSPAMCVILTTGNPQKYTNCRKRKRKNKDRKTGEWGAEVLQRLGKNEDFFSFCPLSKHSALKRYWVSGEIKDLVSIHK